MRLVLDTNVLVSAFLWKGKPGRLIELAAEKEIEIFTSRALLDELAATPSRKKLAPPLRRFPGLPGRSLAARWFPDA